MPFPAPNSQRSVLDIERYRTRESEKNYAYRIKPIPNPTPFPKLFARSMQRIIPMMKLTNGINNRITHQPGRPTILQRIYLCRSG